MKLENFLFHLDVEEENLFDSYNADDVHPNAKLYFLCNSENEIEISWVLKNYNFPTEFE